MTIHTMISVLREKIRGVVSREMLLKEHGITSKDPIPEAVANAILPTFEALSEESLLMKCLHGGTQNQNETINGLIWQRATKETPACQQLSWQPFWQWHASMMKNYLR